jgi:hypothetical protein
MHQNLLPNKALASWDDICSFSQSKVQTLW